MCICGRAPQCRTALQNWQEKTQKLLPRRSRSWNTCQGFLKIPSRCQAALESERCFSKVILESNVTPNITRSSDSFSTVPPIVYEGDLGCIVRELETIKVFLLLGFKFTQKRLQNSLTFTRLRLTDSYCNSITPRDCTTAIKVDLSA